MIKFSRFILIFSGTIFSAFIFLVGLYAASPDFRGVVTGTIAGDSDIPVVRNDDFKADAYETGFPEEMADIVDENPQETALFPVAEDPGAEAAEDEPERLIVDKQYHEDCGTGEGYWVITYSDGSTEIE